MNPWLVFLGMAAVTYLTRFAMMPLMGRELPRPLLAWLRFVPVALLSALIAPAIFVSERQLVIGPQVASAFVGVLVAWRTRSVLWTILAGMACQLLLTQVL